MLFVSAIISILGPISEIWYFADYWHPVTLLSHSAVNIEDLVFSFALGGIVFGLYKTAFGLTASEARQYPRRKWFPLLAVTEVLGALIIFSTYLRFNSVVVTVGAFSLLALLIWFKRKDLVGPSILSGLLTTVIFLLIYQVMFKFVSDLGPEWCKECNPSGIVLYGVNVEELLWDFTWGVVGGVSYEFVSGRGFSPLFLQRHQDTKGILASFASFDDHLNAKDACTLDSYLCRVAATSTRRVLLIRLCRTTTYWLSRVVGFPLSTKYGTVLILAVPILLDIPFSVIGFQTTGTAFFWVVFYCVLTYCLFWFSESSWLSLVNLSASIHNVFDSEAEREELGKLLNDQLNWKRQLAWSALIASGGLAVVLFSAPFFSQFMRLGFATYFQVFLNAFLEGNVIYWFVRTQAYTFHLRASHLKLLWFSPADTPAISGLSTLLARCSIRGLIGALLTVFPPFYYLSTSASADMAFVTSALFTLALLTIIAVTIVPQMRLVEVAKNAKGRLLLTLEDEIRELESQQHRDSSVAEKVMLYHAIRNAPVSVINLDNVARYLLAIALAAFPSLFNLFYGPLSGASP